VKTTRVQFFETQASAAACLAVSTQYSEKIASNTFGIPHDIRRTPSDLLSTILAPAPLKLRPYGAIQIRLLLLLLSSVERAIYQATSFPMLVQYEVYWAFRGFISLDILLRTEQLQLPLKTTNVRSTTQMRIQTAGMAFGRHRSVFLSCYRCSWQLCKAFNYRILTHVRFRAHAKIASRIVSHNANSQARHPHRTRLVPRGPTLRRGLRTVTSGNLCRTSEEDDKFAAMQD